MVDAACRSESRRILFTLIRDDFVRAGVSYDGATTSAGGTVVFQARGD